MTFIVRYKVSFLRLECITNGSSLETEVLGKRIRVANLRMMIRDLRKVMVLHPSKGSCREHVSNLQVFGKLICICSQVTTKTTT